MNNPKRQSNSAGFTLIELLVTASILGILASIAMVNLSSTWPETDCYPPPGNWKTGSMTNAGTQ